MTDETKANAAPQDNGPASVIRRTLALGVNVDSHEELPKAGRNITKFLTSIDLAHGVFEINIAVSVNPDRGEGVGAITLNPPPESPPVIQVYTVQDEEDYGDGGEEDAV